MAMYDQLEGLFWEYFPLPVVFAIALVMLTPIAIFWRGGADFLEPDKWKSLALTKKTIVNHNTRVFR